jgi:hypothetical protein
MTMREIQDLTIDLARGAERVDAIFRERAARFAEWLQRATGENGTCRITAVPLGNFPGLPRFSGDPTAFPIPPGFRAHYGGADVELHRFRVMGGRPIVRGVRKYENDDSVRMEIFEFGLIDLWYRHQPTERGNHFFIGWLLGAYLAVLHVIDIARSMASVPDWEFAIEFALDGLTGAPRHGGGRVPLSALSVAGFNGFHTMRIEELPVRFPRIPYRSRGERESIINTVLDDLGDAAGESPGPRLGLLADESG